MLYHFCRLQLPGVVLGRDQFDLHLSRTHELWAAKATDSARFDVYLDGLYPQDWYVACGCLESDARAWEYLFAARAYRADCLLVDALRARAVRLYPRNEGEQESAVTDFWSHLLVADAEGSLPVLARYDGQRPLVPWLIRVFQNWHVSRLRHHAEVQALADSELPIAAGAGRDEYWHEAFCAAARESLGALSDGELLILGLRLRYRLSQREVAHVLGLHEGTISRQTTQLRERCLGQIGARLTAEGWTGDGLADYVRDEMGSVLMDDPRLSADSLARMLARLGKQLSGEFLPDTD
jgi:RNA polymerase sigma factor (sigma-70 family)